MNAFFCYIGQPKSCKYHRNPSINIHLIEKSSWLFSNVIFLGLFPMIVCDIDYCMLEAEDIVTFL